MTDPAPPGEYQMWDEPPPIIYEHGDGPDLWPDPELPGQDNAHSNSRYSTPFPIHCLPIDMRRIAAEVAASLQVPPALPALACLAAVAVFAGPRARIQQRPGYHEALNLAVLVSLPPGSLKSKTFDEIAEPFAGIERQMREQFETDREQLLDQMDEHLDQMDDGYAKEQFEAKIEIVKKLPGTRLLVQNATPEAMEQLALANGGVANIFDGESTAIGNISGRYNNGKPNLEFALIGYDCSSYRVDRVGSGHKSVDRTCLTMCLATQPSVMQALYEPKTTMHERGLLGRFILASPQPIDDRTTDPPPVSDEAREAWEKLLCRITDLPLPQVHDPLYQLGPDAGVHGPQYRPPTIGLSPEAMQLHFQFETAMNELKHSETGRLVFMGDWVAKHYGRVLRIAALLHLGRGHSVEHLVARDTMAAAVEIGWWMVESAKRVYLGWASPEVAAEDDRLEALRSWWVRRGCPEVFTRREVMSGLKGRSWVKKAEDLQGPLRALAELGWWREDDMLDSLGRPSHGRKSYAVNPKLAEFLRGVTTS